MNILPKKRWHVRTKDNIARVRRDEAAAREEDQKRTDKLELAESEARINFLRRQSGLPEKSNTQNRSVKDAHNTAASVGTHVDLFADYRTHIKTTNKDLEKERKEEQEKYEKQIGYLTYLGQDTNESLKVRSWYEVAPKRDEIDDRNTTETHLKHKLSQDPLTLIKALLPTEKKPVNTIKKRRLTPTPEPVPVTTIQSKKSKKEKREHKKHSKNKRHKSKKSSKGAHNVKKSFAEDERRKREKLERLRKERLRREEAERQRQDALFAPKETAALTTATTTPAPTPRIVQKYNSQFNPEYAKQNMV